ncbi:flippase-like domain-containing protein [Pontibacter sp. E15-1]|uniref:lysylphosphatidylglycerol synthase transmembrane domain-containing protein n=1 Tax=Pontibacter sp. E15-1 TaxID=2919918 RepID=UPI001F50102A|nr:lysylphosphatidylglycerol synthase transmembrane domain-containing protein [Pontibacter sp. E15-1]MCJ8167373.1 flippase-like domain-containing protein [Pontibacter sp. E15-1]
MTVSEKKLRKKFTVRYLALPTVLGLSVIAYLLYAGYEPGQFGIILQANFYWVGMAVAVLIVRDLGNMYRIRYITDQVLSWKQSFSVIMLWEFAACALPTVVGGTSVLAYILFKEKIPLGRSIGKVMVISMLDNLYFVLAVPLVLYFTKGILLPELVGIPGALRETLAVAFIVSYVLVALSAFTMFYALFINPHAVKRGLLYTCRIRLFGKWRQAILRHANELLLSSKHLRSKPAAYWFRAGVSTVFVWTARYIIIGLLIAAFTTLNLHDHVVIFSRNLIYKIVLFVSVTPGAAGIAELAFPAFFGAYLGSFTAIAVFVYRILTHYLYLIIGAVVFPRWAARVFKSEHAHVEPEHAGELQEDRRKRLQA